MNLYQQPGSSNLIGQISVSALFVIKNVNLYQQPGSSKWAGHLNLFSMESVNTRDHHIAQLLLNLVLAEASR